jgi:hypothetical protein
MIDAMLFRADGTSERIEVRDFAHLQELVGGYVEPVYAGIYAFLMDEDAKMKRSQPNYTVTDLLNDRGAHVISAYDMVRGDVVQMTIENWRTM